MNENSLRRQPYFCGFRGVWDFFEFLGFFGILGFLGGGFWEAWSVKVGGRKRWITDLAPKTAVRSVKPGGGRRAIYRPGLENRC